MNVLNDLYLISVANGLRLFIEFLVGTNHEGMRKMILSSLPSLLAFSGKKNSDRNLFRNQV